MNSSHSQQKFSPFQSLTLNYSPVSYNNSNMNSKAIVQGFGHAHYRTGSNHRNIIQDKSDKSPIIIRDQRVFFRSDSAKHL